MILFIHQDDTFWRRERDSNPRYLAANSFSRAARSTTLPPLHGDSISNTKYYEKVGLRFKSQNLL